VDRLPDQLSRVLTDDIRERTGAESRWIRQLDDGIFLHVAHPFLGQELTASEHDHDTQPVRTSPN
jgi:hypothetical protein